MLQTAITALKEIAGKQKTIATTKLQIHLGAIESEMQKADMIITNQRRELEQLREVKRKHQIAMKDYENLKAKNKRLKDEYNILLAKQ